MQRRQLLQLGTVLFLGACGKGYYRNLLRELYQEDKIKEAEALELK